MTDHASGDRDGGTDSSAAAGQPREPLESVIERFEAAWQAGEPDLDGFLAARPGDTELTIELCLVDLEYRRKRGRPRDPEAYADRFPDAAVRRRFLDEAAATSAAPAALAPDALLGSVLGDVRLMRLVGDGGMGRVYEGLQERPRRAVAVKVMKPGLTSASLLRRFEHEAEVLARLRHPGIAQIHAVGTAEVDGRTIPYFVMEYLPDARPITRYAADLGLSTHERLELFQKVCDAVAHGHQKGVIHRDLKPGNVLVDTTGQPKVIDFGVARSTDADVALTTMQTDVGALVGTLQYMSPEQFDADPDDLDIRLDVYALGVILYELLAGQPPYDVRQKAIYEVARVVREVDPTPLSTVNRTLRRDVSVIAGKCLEKDRGRRYSSASELSADVGRYLAGEPIMAAPPSLWDGVVRLARRHKAAAAAVAGIAASLVAAVIGISAFAIHAERARVEAETARVEAVDARDEAETQRAAAAAERDAAARARTAEAEQRAAAEAESLNAKRRLYVANLFRLQAELDRPQRGRARALFAEAQAAHAAVTSTRTTTPLELTLLRPALDQSIASFAGGASALFSPEGERLAIASLDGTVHLRDARTGEQIAAIGDRTPGVQPIAFSPDGTRLAVGSRDGGVRVWDVQTSRVVARMRGLPRPVNFLAFASEGNRVVTSAPMDKCHVWDARSGDCVAILGDAGGRVCVSADGKWLATHGPDAVRVWDVATGEAVAAMAAKRDAYNALATTFSPDGTTLATSADASGVRLWDLATGDARPDLQNPAGEGRDFAVSTAFSPDGKRLVAGTARGGFRLWNLDTGQAIAFRAPFQGVVSTAFNGDGSRVVAWSPIDTAAYLVNGVTGELVGVLHGHAARITVCTFSPDATRLATASDDNSVRVWDAMTGRLIEVLTGHEAPVHTLAFHPDGSRLVTCALDQAIRLWDTTTGESPLTKADCRACAWNPDGTRLALARDRAIHLWDARTGESLAVLESRPGSEVHAVAFNHDGSRLAATCSDGSVRLWDAVTGALVATPPTGTDGGFVFSPDGAQLATYSRRSGDPGIVLWQATTGTRVAALPPHRSPLVSVAFDPTGSQVAASHADRSIRVFDPRTGKPVSTFHDPEALMPALHFSPDGSILALASRERVHFWDTAVGKPAGTLRMQGIQRFVFSPDGVNAATDAPNHGACLWNLRHKKPYAVLNAHLDHVRALAYSPDGTRLATGSRDKTIRLWDASSGELLVVREGLAPVTEITFSPDGSRVATQECRDGHLRGTVRVWGVSRADVHRHRLAAAVARKRLAPIVEQWFADDRVAVQVKLEAARATMPPDDWREAANLVLIRATGERRSPDP